jgi:hypothetical protein
MGVLQTPALPLGYVALCINYCKQYSRLLQLVGFKTPFSPLCEGGGWLVTPN